MRISDWSSDVCSSDLSFEPLGQDVGADARKIHAEIAEPLWAQHQLAHHQQRPSFADEIKRMRRTTGVFIAAARGDLRRSYFSRSEERRVGKECVSPCRSRWSQYH